MRSHDPIRKLSHRPHSLALKGTSSIHELTSSAQTRRERHITATALDLACRSQLSEHLGREPTCLLSQRGE